MRTRQLINMLKQLDEDKACELLVKIMKDIWLRGYNRRDLVEKKINGFRIINRKKMEDELSIISERLSRQGYFGKYLEQKTWEEYLNSDKNDFKE